MASPETWGVDSRKLTPVRNFPGGFVEQVIDVPKTTLKQQASQHQQQKHQQQITSKATHVPKNNKQTANPQNKVSISQNPQNLPYKQHGTIQTSQYQQQNNSQQLPHSSSTPNFHKPVTNQNNLQKSHSRPEFNLHECAINNFIVCHLLAKYPFFESL